MRAWCNLTLHLQKPIRNGSETTRREESAERQWYPRTDHGSATEKDGGCFGGAEFAAATGLLNRLATTSKGVGGAIYKKMAPGG